MTQRYEKVSRALGLEELILLKSPYCLKQYADLISRKMVGLSHTAIHGEGAGEERKTNRSRL